MLDVQEIARPVLIRLLSSELPVEHLMTLRKNRMWIVENDMKRQRLTLISKPNKRTWMENVI